MGITLLTLSRQHAAGKLATADYRAQRRKLIDQQVFQLEERTMPGFKEAERGDTTVGGDLTQPSHQASETATHPPSFSQATTPYTQAMPEPSMSGSSMSGVAASADTTAFMTRKRLGELAQSETKQTAPRSSRKPLYWLAAIVLAFVVVATVGWLMLQPTEEPQAVVASPLLTSTHFLLDNPDWQLSELRAYRAQLASQQEPMLAEQQALLDSINLYLSVPVNGEVSELEQELQLLKQDLTTLGKTP